MRHEKIIKRENGDELKITVSQETSWRLGYVYHVDVSLKKRRNKNFKCVIESSKLHFNGACLLDENNMAITINGTISVDGIWREYIHLKYVTPAEILTAKLELWEKIKPV